MATKKASRKKAAKRSPRKARPRNVVPTKKAAPKKSAKEKEPTTLAESNGKATKQAAIKKSRGKADLDPNQKTLPGIEEPERIPAIERAIKDYIEAESRQKKASEDMKIAVDKLPGLFKKHKTQDYTCIGRTAVLTHGPDQVKFKRASTK